MEWLPSCSPTPGTAGSADSPSLALGRLLVYVVLNVYAMRTAAVFTISTATIAMRTRVISLGQPLIPVATPAR